MMRSPRMDEMTAPIEKKTLSPVRRNWDRVGMFSRKMVPSVGMDPCLRGKRERERFSARIDAFERKDSLNSLPLPFPTRKSRSSKSQNSQRNSQPIQRAP